MNRSGSTWRVLVGAALMMGACDSDGTGAGDAAASDTNTDGAPNDTASAHDVTIDASPGTLVFSLRGTIGFLHGWADSFHNQRHGQPAVFVYGDGRVIHDGQGAEWGLDQGCRAYQTYMLDSAGMEALLALVDPAAMAPANGHAYLNCQCADCGDETLTVQVEGFSLETSAIPSLSAFPPICESWEDGPPPPAVLELAAALAPLRNNPGEALTTASGLLVAGCAMTDGDLPAGCVQDPPQPWPFDPTTALTPCTATWQPGQSITVSAAQAGPARDFLDALPLLADGFKDSRVARHDDTCYLLTCDRLLPHEE